jgi:2-polyprenyl-6-hydroxyphenyl methylase/3-demethylubiquinone-9 3-methyltransferase
MKLPEKSTLVKNTYQKLFDWDIREYFATDKKNFTALYFDRRLRIVMDSIRNLISKGGTILDIGCGQGNFSILLAEEGYQVIGCEINSEALEYALLRYEFGNCQFVVADGSRLPFNIKFDAIILAEILEHVTHPQEILKECFDHLNNNGIIIISTPNKTAFHNWRCLSYTQISNGTISKPITSFYTRGEVVHEFNFKNKELANLLKKSGFEILTLDTIGSYFVNPSNIHKVLPYSWIYKIDSFFSDIPWLNNYMTTTLFCVSKRPA